MRTPFALVGLAIYTGTFLIGTASAAEPLTLDLHEVRAMAESHSPELRSATAQLEAAESLGRAAMGRLLPRADLSASYTRQSYVEPAAIEIPADVAGMVLGPLVLGESVQDRYSTRVTLEQPLAGGGLIHAWRGSREDRSVYAAKRASVVQDVRLDATERWLDLAAARAAAEVAVQAEKAMESHLDRVERMAAAGSATRLSVAEARARLAAASERRISAEGEVAVVRVGLASLIGVALDTPIEIAEIPDQHQTRSATESPVLQAARASVRVADHKASVEAADLWPRVALRAGY